MIFKYVLAILLPLTAIFAGCDGSSHAASPATAAAQTGLTFPVSHTDAEWRKLLTPAQYDILRQQGTEPPFSGEYDTFFKPGTYRCAACDHELFSSDTKFDSHSGWPSFYAPKDTNSVKLIRDSSLGEIRTEVICANCGSHLGHVFDDAPQTPTGKRFCMDSLALKFVPAATQPNTQPATNPAATK